MLWVEATVWLKLVLSPSRVEEVVGEFLLHGGLRKRTGRRRQDPTGRMLRIIRQRTLVAMSKRQRSVQHATRNAAERKPWAEWQQHEPFGCGLLPTSFRRGWGDLLVGAIHHRWPDTSWRNSAAPPESHCSKATYLTWPFLMLYCVQPHMQTAREEEGCRLAWHSAIKEMGRHHHLDV